jgi:hypothetical protein
MAANGFTKCSVKLPAFISIASQRDAMSSGDVRNGLDFDFGLHAILLAYDCAKSERS